ncbi:MAG: hypothetical protein ACYCX4_01760, partial [Bacillota bacterium]
MQYQKALGGQPKPYEEPYRNANYISLGKVIAIKPENYAVDVALLAGGILRNVQVIAPSAGTKAGYNYLTNIQNTRKQDSPGGVLDSPLGSQKGDTYAVIAFLQGNMTLPICLGFLYPEVTQMLFSEKGLKIDRHENGIYELLDKDGNHETVYPDGSYIKVGNGKAIRDL